MDNSSDYLEKLESALKEDTLRRKLVLYRDNKHQNVQDISKPQYNFKDIISKVDSELKAIQRAENATSSKIVVKNLDKYKNFEFLSVSQLPKNDEVNQERQTNKFETQGVSDSQLINIVHDAEALIETGITQELDTIFRYTNIDDDHANKSEKENVISENRFESEYDVPCNSKQLVAQENMIPKKIIQDFNEEFNVIKSNMQVNKDMAKYDTHEKRDNNCTQVINECFKSESNLNQFITIEENLTSPILNFNVKSLKITPNTSPLVFDLESFEKFEKIAVPIIEENSNIETAKHLINSHIIGIELCLDTNTESKLHEGNGIISKQIKMNDKNVYIDETNYSPQKYIKRNVVIKEEINECKNHCKLDKVLEDAVLFSSDEEEDYKKNSQELPFTCVLDTSYFDQLDTLDKTMYVGFQTASNKSIQICTHSFNKAKSLLKDVERNTHDKELTMTELVELCDNITGDNKNISNACIENDCDIIKTVERDKKESDTICYQSNESHLNKDNITYATAEESKESLLINKEIKSLLDTNNHENKNKRVPELNKYICEGFETASNKEIRLSKDALVRCKKVFQDIDLNETVDHQEPSTSKHSSDIISVERNFRNTNEALKCLSKVTGAMGIDNKHKQEIHITENIEDENIIQEFECHEMLYTNVEMNESSYKDTFKFVGFKTASNKNIVISDDAFAKTKNIFQDVYLDDKENIKIRQECEEKKEREIAIEIFPENVNVLKSRNNIIKKQNKINMAPQDQHFVGSKSASNKQIKIFQQDLFKTKDVESIDYADIKVKEGNPNINEYILTPDFISNNLNQPSICKTPFPGFKTANKKEIENSKEAVMKSENLFQHINNEYFLENPSTSKEHTGFKTVNDKEVNLYEENCTTPGDIFYDLNECFNQPSTSITPFPGFKTANNKEITISKEALIKSRNLLQDIENEEFCYKKSPTSKESGTDFKAVNEEEYEIPEQTCPKTGDILKDIDDKHFKQPSTTREFLIGCKIANNKETKISKQSLAKTNNIFQDIHNDNLNETPENFEINKFKCLGFKTASNKEVRLSNEALTNNKHIFKNILKCHDEDQDSASNTQIEKCHTFQGFQTASNKSVTISAEALSKTKHIFQDIDVPMEVPNREPENNMQGLKNLDVNITFQGFKTASNKKVTILDEALAKTRNIFQGIDIEEDSTSTDIERTPFKGFQTASNKKIKISENALVKTKSMFHDIDSAIYKKDISEVEINYNSKLLVDKLVETTGNEKQCDNREIGLGFKTANYQTIKISEEALKQSRKIFTDIDAEKVNKSISEQNHTIKDDIRFEINKNCDDINISNIINTQVLNDFNDTLCTEDFCKDVTPNRSKRSGSPILSCPKAKKRKSFKAPLRSDNKVDIAIDNPTFSVNKTENVYTFKDNYKKNKVYTLKDLNKLEKEFSNNTQNADLLKLKFNYLLDFQFSATRNDLTAVNMTVNELKKIFLMAVDSRIVPDGWLDNHIKLILWKLLSYEITFPNVMKNICTVKNVIEQLKYRYDRELYQVERPILRKILEKDDTSLRSMVLCVMDIIETGSGVDSSAKNLELLVTDGWYCVKASLDRMLTKLVHDGKIVVGTKIVTNGAELLNCEQGVAPWEDTSDVRLKLFGNSTRRAPWHCRLGLHGNGAVSSRLSTVRVDGGRVSRLRVFVARVYPPLYIEKFDDGSTVTRSERLQNIHQMKYETERQMLLEKIYEEVEKEYSDQDSSDSEVLIDTSNKRKYLESGSQIAKMMKRSKDPVEFSTYLTESQSKLLVEHKCKQREKLMRDIQNRVEEKMAKCGINNTKVVPLLKARIADVEERNGKIQVTKGMLSIWKPNEDILEIIKEGVWVELLNVVPTGVRHLEVQISAGRQSIFHKSKYKENKKIKPYTKNLERICYNIKNVAENPTMNTDYNEIDTVGLIFHTEPSNEEFTFNKQPFQNVFLTDTEKNIISVNFWGGIKKFGFENALNTGEIVACINLQKRAGNTRRGILQFRATEFTYFTKSPKNESAKLLLEDLCKKFKNINKQRFCEECLVAKNNYAALKYQSNENISPYRLNNSEYDISKNRLFVDSPLPQKLNNIDKNLDLTGIDFESSFKERDTEELSPNTLLRKKRVNEKIAKLKMYGEPPPLSPIYIINKSKDAGKPYKSPLLITNNVSDGVANTEVNLPNDFQETTIEDTKNEEIQSSPVITTRKHEKRKSINPVKLNFSNMRVMEENINDTVQFGEDFEFSPPLSLD